MPLTYHAPSKKFVLDADTLAHAAASLLFAIQQIRKTAGLPLEPYARSTQLTPVDHAQKALIDHAEQLGIDLGARWGNELDVRNVY